MWNMLWGCFGLKPYGLLPGSQAMLTRLRLLADRFELAGGRNECRLPQAGRPMSEL